VWRHITNFEKTKKTSAQEWRNHTLLGHEPLICSKMCFTPLAGSDALWKSGPEFGPATGVTKTELVQ
jgi:hypothetical protein